jgi:Family of unknown function (DUF6000)
MRNPADGPDLAAASRLYVTPDGRYMKLLHGDFGQHLDEPKRTAFVQDLIAAARQATTDEITLLLEGGWRERLTGAVLAGLSRRAQLRGRIGQLLLDSEAPYAGHGYCFALAAFGTAQDAELLTQYLDRYLPQTQLRYDQNWAMAALQHLDDASGTTHAERFLTPNGLWRRWATTNPDPASKLDNCRALINQLCAL